MIVNLDQHTLTTEEVDAIAWFYGLTDDSVNQYWCAMFLRARGLYALDQTVSDYRTHLTQAIIQPTLPLSGT